MIYLFLYSSKVTPSEEMPWVSDLTLSLADYKALCNQIPELMDQLKDDSAFSLPLGEDPDEALFLTEEQEHRLTVAGFNYLINQLNGFFYQAFNLADGDTEFTVSVDDPVGKMVANFMSFSKGVTDTEWTTGVLAAIPMSREEGCPSLRGSHELVHKEPRYTFPTMDVITPAVQRCMFTTYVARYKDGRVALIRGEPTSGKHGSDGFIEEFSRVPKPVLDWHEMETLTRVTHGAYTDLDFNYGVSWKHFVMCYQPVAENLDVRIQST